MRELLPTILACRVDAMNASTARAQVSPSNDGAPHGVVATRPGVFPECDGSGDMRVFPFVLADSTWRRSGGVATGYRFSRRFDITARANASYLVATSPIVRSPMTAAIGLSAEQGRADIRPRYPFSQGRDRPCANSRLTAHAEGKSLT